MLPGDGGTAGAVRVGCQRKREAGQVIVIGSARFQVEWLAALVQNLHPPTHRHPDLIESCCHRAAHDLLAASEEIAGHRGCRVHVFPVSLQNFPAGEFSDIDDSGHRDRGEGRTVIDEKGVDSGGRRKLEVAKLATQAHLRDVGNSL